MAKEAHVMYSGDQISTESISTTSSEVYFWSSFEPAV